MHVDHLKFNAVQNNLTFQYLVSGAFQPLKNYLG